MTFGALTKIVPLKFICLQFEICSHWGPFYVEKLKSDIVIAFRFANKLPGPSRGSPAVVGLSCRLRIAHWGSFTLSNAER